MKEHHCRSSKSSLATQLLKLMAPLPIIMFANAQVLAAETFCKDTALNSRVESALMHSLDLEGLERLLNDSNLLSCSPRAKYCISLMTNLGYVDQAYDLLRKNPPDLPGALTQLEAGKKYSLSWQGLALEGDIDAKLARDSSNPELYSKSSNAFHQSLNEIDSVVICPDDLRPSPSDIVLIRERAVTSLLLAPTFTLGRSKCGCCGGTLAKKIRSVYFDRFWVPFSFLESDFSLDKNKEIALDALLQCLDGVSNITLIGHADALESNSDVISKRRAEVVAGYLRSKGFLGKLKTVSIGSSQPLTPPDMKDYSPAELQQLNRRVEYIFDDDVK